MNAVLRAELRKVRATPTVWWLLLGTVAIGVLGTLAPLIASDSTENMLTDRKLQEAMHGAAAGSILVLVTGIIGMAGEFRHGMATQTFLTTPRRRDVIVAKTVTYLGIGTAFGVAAGAAATVTAWAWYAADGLTFPFDRSAVWLTLLGCLAVSMLYGMLGVGIGSILRNQVGAIVGTLAWMMLVEQALFAAAPKVFRWLPATASLALRRQPNDDLLGVTPAAIVVTGVVLAALVVGARAVDRADVTA